MEAGTIIRKSKEYIEKHIDEVLTVAKIAGTVGYSEYHFSRIFRQETRLKNPHIPDIFDRQRL